MTKSEQIRFLEAGLRAASLELEKVKEELAQRKRNDARLVYAEHRAVIHDLEGLHEEIVVHLLDTPYGAGQFDLDGFHKALDVWCKKWNELALEARENQFKTA